MTDSSEGSDSEEEEKAPAAAPLKRKAEADVEPVAKKAKTTTEGEGEGEATGNLFVGNLSWNVDEEWLVAEFEKFGELVYQWVRHEVELRGEAEVNSWYWEVSVAERGC